MTDTFADSLHLLRTRRFGTFVGAGLLSNLGTWAQQVAEPWLLLSLGASSFLIGLDSFALSAPVWMLTLLGGILADVADRRHIIAICQSIQMLCPTLLVVLLLTGTVEPWIVIALSFVVGITDALSMPSFQSIVPSIVRRSQIPAALALNATQFNLSRILGPALAGVLMATLGAVGCFALNAASYVPFIWVALWILPRGRPPRAQEEPLHLFAGVAQVAGMPHLRGALVTVFATSLLCGPLFVFCPVLVKEALHRGVGDFSFAVGAFGVGGLVGAVALLGIDPSYDRRRLSAGFAALYGFIMVLTGINAWFFTLPPLLLLAGVAMAITNISANSLLQATTLPKLRGQTISLYMLALRGGLSIGSLATGASVHLLGVRDALIVNGALAIAVQLAVAREWLRTAVPTAN
jgi:predicted MFS family arabinose efflux permease